MAIGYPHQENSPLFERHKFFPVALRVGAETWRVKKAHLLKFSSELKCSVKIPNFHALQQQFSVKAFFVFSPLELWFKKSTLTI